MKAPKQLLIPNLQAVDTWFQNNRGTVANKTAEDVPDANPGSNWQYLYAKENPDIIRDVSRELGVEGTGIGGWRRAVSVAANNLNDEEQEELQDRFAALQKALPSKKDQAKYACPNTYTNSSLTQLHRNRSKVLAKDTEEYQAAMWQHCRVCMIVFATWREDEDTKWMM